MAARMLLSLRGVTLGYAQARQVLRDVSLDVESGAFACVVGANGAGKTTLLRAMSGTLPPLSGEITLEDRSLASMRRDEIARRIAVVPQDLPVVEGFTVREVVAMGRAPHQGRWMRPSSHDDEIVARALRRCSLDALADRPFDALSGGERKRATIAQALAQEPKLLLLDEPSAFLDVRHALEIFELLRAEVGRGLAVVANVHDLPLAGRWADRVVVLARGSIAASGPAVEVMTPAILRDAFDVEWIDAGGALLPAAYLKRRSPG